ncbi:MAG: dihydroneopterin aldolase [Candidatus Peribacteria bacterium]|nr:MAG: dihydroneopterin aldolase [Candidatus Peribacteria bacterium]
MIFKNLQIETILGVHDYEKKLRLFTVQLEIDFNPGIAATTDYIGDTLNYSEIEKKIVNHVRTQDYNLIERLVEDILNLVLEYDQVLSCRAIVEKKGCTKYSESICMEQYKDRN